ncbi:hypothetical protein TKK_0008159 [Trichogramma kaykai]
MPYVSKGLTSVKMRLPLIITITITEAFEVIKIDIVGPLPIIASRSKYLLTIQCNLTKFGCPKIIRGNQGLNLIRKTFSSMAKIFKIAQFKSTAYRPKDHSKEANTLSSST